MSEKLKNTPKTKPIQKKAPEKKDVLKMQKDCKVETRKELTKINLDNLKDQIWHTVKAWENIWRIIYNHAEKTGKKPISPKKLEWINISVWDKVYFTNKEVIIKYIKWGTKKVSFENNQICSENPSTKKPSIDKKTISKQPENSQTISIEDEIKLWERNEKQIEEIIKKEQQQNQTEKKESKEQTQTIQTIFDKDSPLLWDKIAYKNEVEIRKNYGKKISELIQKYCKWSLVDEEFLYGVIARESRFDKNAKSYTWVKWLWQLTTDTIKTLVNIHEAKLKNNPNMHELYITQNITNGSKKDKRGFYDINGKESLKPINQIKLIISYLMYLEDLFNDIKDKNFKTELIITSYNLGPWKTQEILEKHKNIKNWEWLKKALEKEAAKWNISKDKFSEVSRYVPAVKEHIARWEEIKIASL